MPDHGLFQAICPVNRLDSEDKDFGYIVDYKDLFKKVENAIAVYTSELDHSAGGVDPEVLLKDRLKKGKERLDDALLARKGPILHRHRGAAVANALTLATAQPKQVDWLDPADILTPEQLAKRLQVSKSWVFEQTRNRAKVRNKHPLPCIRLGKYIRFSWSEVCQWMRENNG